jgi:hypothetical protein
VPSGVIIGETDMTRAPTTPARNRVTPYGDIQALPLRGAWTGNRGILHAGPEIVRFHGHDAWITCALTFKGRHAEDLWAPHHYTWLFFHDEAVAMAAGHRPCGECRRGAYDAYRAAWSEGLGEPVPRAREMNRRLHAERLVRGTHRRRFHQARARELPDGAFVELDGAPWLLLGDEAVAWTPDGYATRRSRPRSGDVTVITPPATVAVLRAGYDAQIDPSARGRG